MILKNKSGQGIYLYAYVAATLVAKTGDAANITGFRSLDGAAETSGFTTTHPTEIGHGIYWQPLTQGEANGEAYSYAWSSSTGGVVVRPETGFTAAVQLADAVAHGGTLGSSTATLALSRASVHCSDASNPALLVENATGPAAQVLSNSAGYPSLLIYNQNGTGAFLLGGGANGDGLGIEGSGSGHALGLYGSATGGTLHIEGAYTSGAAIDISTTDGSGISITATGGYGVDSTLSPTLLASIADVTLRRHMANAESSSVGDSLSKSSLYGSVQAQQKSTISGTTLTVYETDGTTTLGTFTLTVSASADPITAVS